MSKCHDYAEILESQAEIAFVDIAGLIDFLSRCSSASLCLQKPRDRYLADASIHSAMVLARNDFYSCHLQFLNRNGETGMWSFQKLEM
jgi:hypothetical protein